MEIFFFWLSPRSDCGDNDSYPKYGVAVIAKLDSHVEYLMLNDFCKTKSIDYFWTGLAEFFSKLIASLACKFSHSVLVLSGTGN